MGSLPLCTSHSINMFRVTPPRSILDLYHCLNVYFKDIGNRRVMNWIVLWARTASLSTKYKGRPTFGENDITLPIRPKPWYLDNLTPRSRRHEASGGHFE